MNDITSEVNNWADECWEESRESQFGEGLSYTSLNWNDEEENYEVAFATSNGLSVETMPVDILEPIEERVSKFDKLYKLLADNAEPTGKKLHAWILNEELFLSRTVSWHRTPTDEDVRRVRNAVVDETICDPSEIISVEVDTEAPPMASVRGTVTYETQTPHEGIVNFDTLEEMAEFRAENGDTTKEEFLGKDVYKSHYHFDGRNSVDVGLEDLVREGDEIDSVVSVDQPLSARLSGLNLNVREHTFSISGVVFADISEL